MKRLSYVLLAAWQGFWRNPVMSLASTLTVSLMLLLFAFFFATDLGRDFEAVCRYDMSRSQWRPVVEREWDLSCAVDWTGRKLRIHANEDGRTRIDLLAESGSEGFYDSLPHRRFAGRPVPDRRQRQRGARNAGAECRARSAAAGQRRGHYGPRWS